MSWLGKKTLKNQLKSVGENVLIDSGVTIIGGKNIEIGNNVRIDAGAILMAGGDGAFLKIGNHIHIGAGSKLMASGGITFEDFSGCGLGCTLVSASDDFSGDYLIGPQVSRNGFGNVTKAPIVLERFAIMATDCTLLPGVRMKEGSILGVKSLAMTNLQPWSTYFGCPARFIKKRSEAARELGEKFEAQFQDMLNQQKIDQT